MTETVLVPVLVPVPVLSWRSNTQNSIGNKRGRRLRLPPFWYCQGA